MMALLLTSCASTRLKPEAAHVVVSKDAPPASCKNIGRVDSYTYVNAARAENNNVLINVVKNNAHELGGNYVFTDVVTSLKIEGDVYNCP